MESKRYKVFIHREEDGLDICGVQFYDTLTQDSQEFGYPNGEEDPMLLWFHSKVNALNLIALLVEALGLEEMA